MFCEHCGKQIEDGAKFCEFCGTPTQQEVPQQNEEPQQRTYQQVQQPQYEQAPVYRERPVQQAPKKKQAPQSEGKGMKIAIIVGAVAILFVACVGVGIFLASNKGNKEEAQTAAATEQAGEGTESASSTNKITPAATATPTPKTVTPKAAAGATVTPAATVAPAQTVTETPATTPAATEAPAANDVEAAINSVDSYIIPDSNTRVLSTSELANYTADQIRLIRNEIYAREGYIFTSPDMQNYFGSKNWYNGTIPSASFTNANLNSVEYQNIQLITQYEKDHNINQS